MSGAVAYGLHEGSRSEYLAEYAFASWGTVAAVPHHEDQGIDLHCTLMERVGKRFLAKSPYTVQVKSNRDPLEFEGHALRWLIEHPLPFFLCVVDKKSARLSVYHTLSRFFAWVSKRERVVVVAEPPVSGKETRFFDDTPSRAEEISLGQPIIDFTVDQMLDDEFWGRLRKIFEEWVGIENENLFSVRAKLPTCTAPTWYKTNEKLPSSGRFQVGRLDLGRERFSEVAASAEDQLSWLAEHYREHGDAVGAAKAYLFLRHVYPSGIPLMLHNYLCGVLEDGMLAGIDANLAALVQTELPKLWKIGSEGDDLLKG
jgi:hypothetical protein